MVYVVRRPPRPEAPDAPAPASARAPATGAPASLACAPPPRAALPVLRDALPPLEEMLRARAVPGALYERTEHGAIRCTACAHRCVMEEGRTGACGVRFHQGGELRVPFGYVARRYIRAVETNTIYHVRPGALALTFGMYGCDLRCPYCHNWRVSQALREGVDDEAPLEVRADELAQQAHDAGCEVICGAYNEPMISAEWARAVFTEAKARGMLTAMISDGNTTPEALAYMRPALDVYRVDLKGFDNAQYKTLGGRLAPVLAGIREAHRLGYWVEVVTLVVPGFNDDQRGLRQLADELASIDPDIPWHLNAFYPRYKLASRPPMAGFPLMDAAGMAMARGLRYVYVSNLASEVRELSHTRCAACHVVLVERDDYATRAVHLDADGACPRCGAKAPGLWAPRSIPALPAPAAAAGEQGWPDEMP